MTTQVEQLRDELVAAGADVRPAFKPDGWLQKYIGTGAAKAVGRKNLPELRRLYNAILKAGEEGDGLKQSRLVGQFHGLVRRSNAESLKAGIEALR